jgi:hypothetical protein
MVIEISNAIPTKMSSFDYTKVLTKMAANPNVIEENISSSNTVILSYCMLIDLWKKCPG